MLKNLKKKFTFFLLTLMIMSCQSTEDFTGKYTNFIKPSESIKMYFWNKNSEVIVRNHNGKTLIDYNNNTYNGKIVDKELVFEPFTAYFSNDSILVVKNGAETVEFMKQEYANEIISQVYSSKDLKNYIEEVLYNSTDYEVCVPTDDMRNIHKDDVAAMKQGQEKNPYFPTMVVGDFNGDGLTPDIATLVYSKEKIIDNRSHAKILAVVHAGEKEAIGLTEWSDYECKWLSKMDKQKLQSYWEDDRIKLVGEGILSFCPEKGGGVYYWNEGRYEYYRLSD